MADSTMLGFKGSLANYNKQTMTKRKCYDTEKADNAAQEYAHGEKLSVVCAKYPRLPERTITRMAKRVKEGVVTHYY